MTPTAASRGRSRSMTGCRWPASTGHLHQLLERLGADVAIREAPYGVPMTTPFLNDTTHAAYDPSTCGASGACPTPADRLKDRAG
jgi:hypothetical protein